MLLPFGGVWLGVKIRFDFWVRCVAGCAERGYFRASHLGGRRCFYRLGVCGWVLKFAFVFGCVAWLAASREATLGRRFSEGVVASKVWGCVGGC